MSNRHKVVVRLLNGTLLRGYIRDFSIGDDSVYLEDESANSEKIRLKVVKAIFFVRKFEGNKSHRERKSFTGAKPSRQKVFVKFKDGESVTGFIDGDTPWKTGFFLESVKANGFFLIPTDSDSNNIKIFVITSSVKDVAMIGRPVM